MYIYIHILAFLFGNDPFEKGRFSSICFFLGGGVQLRQRLRFLQRTSPEGFQGVLLGDLRAQIQQISE